MTARTFADEMLRGTTPLSFVASSRPVPAYFAEERTQAGTTGNLDTHIQKPCLTW